MKDLFGNRVPEPDLDPPDDDPPVVFERRMDEYIDDEEQELLDAVADAINMALLERGVGGHWLVDQDTQNRVCYPNFWADFGEIEYPVVAHDGRRLKVVLRVDYIEDANRNRVEKREAL